MRVISKLKRINRNSATLAILFLSFALLGGVVTSVKAAALTSGSVSLSDPRPSETGVTYTFDWSGVTSTNIQCVTVEFTSDLESSTIPTGMDISGANVNASSDYVTGISGWNKSFDGSDDNVMTISDTSGGTPSSTGTLVLDGITNGSVSEEDYYAIFTTYSDSGCNTEIDNGTVQFIYTDGQVVSMTVDAALIFKLTGVASGQTVNGALTNVATTTGSNAIPFGNVTVDTNVIAAHNIAVTTNSAGGYTIYVRYTGQLSGVAGNINNTAGSNASPAAFTAGEAFGYTTDAFDSDTWAAFTTSNLAIDTAETGPASNTFNVGYQVGIDGNTPAGSYTTTIIYTATPTY